MTVLMERHGKAIAKRWGDADPPIVRALNASLSTKGFTEHWFDPSSGYFLWRRELVDDLVAEVDISPDTATNQVVEFTSSVFIASRYIRRLVHELRLYECSDLPASVIPEIRSQTGPTAVLGAHLEWLKWNENPTQQPFWWRVERGQEERIAHEWFAVWQEYGERFVERSNTVEKLVNMLLSLDAYPRRVRIDGLRSPNRSQHLAVLLHCLGRNQEAVRELDTRLQEVRASVARKEIQPIAERVAECEITRLRDCFLAKV